MIACIFDTEDNGLIDNRAISLKKQTEVIEFYGCTVDLSSGEVLHEFHSLFKPKNKLLDEVVKITGITDEMLKGEPPFSQAADAIQALFHTAPVVIGHHLNFDVEAVEIEFERLGRTVEWPRKCCTIEQTIHLLGYRLSQTALYQHLFGETFKDAHRAKPDTQALVRICVELFKRDLI